MPLHLPNLTFSEGQVWVPAVVCPQPQAQVPKTENKQYRSLVGHRKLGALEGEKRRGMGQAACPHRLGSHMVLLDEVPTAGAELKLIFSTPPRTMPSQPVNNGTTRPSEGAHAEFRR